MVALPSARDRTRLADSVFTIAASLRLGLPVASPRLCRCGQALDCLGDHVITCKRGTARSARHSEVNARIRAALTEAGVTSILEPPGLARTDGKRPDGVTVLPFERGLPLAWDATIRHTSAPAYVHLTSINARSAAVFAETVKEKKYAPLAKRAFFMAVGLETLGAFGPSALQLFEAIASRVRARTGEQGVRARPFRRLAAAIQIGNAACIVEAHTLTLPQLGQEL